MKTIKILSILLLSIITLSSCIDDEVNTDGNVDSVNLISFTKASMNTTIIADGGTIDNTLFLKVKGPTAANISNEITASLEIDPSSTAVEGVHFTLGSTSLVFSPDNDLKTSVDFTILSEGIESPLEKTLVLNIVNPSDSSVVPSGRTGQVVITIGYLCPSELVGAYTNPDLIHNDSPNTTFEQLGPGQYRVGSMAGLRWATGDPIYIDIMDSCNEITVTNGELAEFYGATYTGSGVVNDDGSVTFNYIIYKSTGEEWFTSSDSTYTPVP